MCKPQFVLIIRTHVPGSQSALRTLRPSFIHCTASAILPDVVMSAQYQKYAAVSTKLTRFCDLVNEFT